MGKKKKLTSRQIQQVTNRVQKIVSKELKSINLADEYDQKLENYKIFKSRQNLDDIFITLREIDKHPDSDLKEKLPHNWGWAASQYYFEFEDAKSAIDLLEEVNKRYQFRFDIWLILAQIYYKTEQYESSLTFAKMILDNQKKLNNLPKKSHIVNRDAIEKMALMLKALSDYAVIESVYQKFLANGSNVFLDNKKRKLLRNSALEQAQKYQEYYLKWPGPFSIFYNDIADFINEYKIMDDFEKNDYESILNFHKNNKTYSRFMISILMKIWCNNESPKYNPAEIVQYLKEYAVAKPKQRPLIYTILGELYDNGDDLDRDPKLACLYFEIAAQENYGPAFNNLAYKYEFGEDLEINLKKAEEYYKRSYELGYGAAQINLVNMYFRNRRHADMVEITSSLVETYPKNQQLHGMHAIGQYFLMSEENTNHSKSKISPFDLLKLFEKAVGLGDRISARLLALIYLFGTILPADFDKALFYAEKSYELGQLESFETIYEIYSKKIKLASKNEDILKLNQERHSWVEKAANAGSLFAQEILQKGGASKCLSDDLNQKEIISSATSGIFYIASDLGLKPATKLSKILQEQLTERYSLLMQLKAAVYVLEMTEFDRILTDKFSIEIIKIARRIVVDPEALPEHYLILTLQELAHLYFIVDKDIFENLDKIMHLILLRIVGLSKISLPSYRFILAIVARCNFDNELVAAFYSTFWITLFGKQDNNLKNLSLKDLAYVVHNLARIHQSVSYHQDISNFNEAIFKLISYLVSDGKYQELDNNSLHAFTLGVFYFYRIAFISQKDEALESCLKYCHNHFKQNNSNKSTTSHGQLNLFKFCQQQFKTSKVYLEYNINGLDVDIFIEDKKTIVEYDGESHYVRGTDEPVKETEWHKVLLTAKTNWLGEPQPEREIVRIRALDWRACQTDEQRLKLITGEVLVKSEQTKLSTNPFAILAQRPSDDDQSKMNRNILPGKKF